jgi:hypothetical protein
MRIVLLAFLILFGVRIASAQSYDTLEVGMMTTVHVVFEAPVMEYDLGSGTRIEIVNGIEHQVTDVLITRVGDRLKLAAAIDNFETTNLFVETETGYFNFILKYANRPKILSHYISNDKADKMKSVSNSKKKELEKNEVELNAEKSNKILELTLQDLAAKVAIEPNQVIEIGQESQRMKYFLNGIYVKGNYLFFRVNILNEGNVKFDLGYEGFFIKDKANRGVKKTTKQIPEPLKHLFILNESLKVVEKRQEISKVYVFEKFTLETKKIFTIEFWEDGQGQRKVELNIPSSEILEAKIF